MWIQGRTPRSDPLRWAEGERLNSQQSYGHLASLEASENLLRKTKIHPEKLLGYFLLLQNSFVNLSSETTQTHTTISIKICIRLPHLSFISLQHTLCLRTLLTSDAACLFNILTKRSSPTLRGHEGRKNDYNICSRGRNSEVSAEINCLLHESCHCWHPEATQRAAQIQENKPGLFPTWLRCTEQPARLLPLTDRNGVFKAHDVPMEDIRCSKNPLSDPRRLVVLFQPLPFENSTFGLFSSISKPISSGYLTIPPSAKHLFFFRGLMRSHHVDS